MKRFRFAYENGAKLFGETSDWLNPIELPCELELPPGVYQYKFLHGETWLIDPRAERTRSRKGLKNGVVVSDGAPEPFLFAPASPWIEELARGGVRILVGVRRGHPLKAFRWREGESWSTATLEPAFEEDEHLFFAATLPTSTKTIEIDLDGFHTSWTRAPARERLPAWWTRAVLYTIFVDRFRPAEPRADWERDPGRGRKAGGHLEGIRRSLPELADLGITALYLTPVHVGASAHRYDIVDPLRVDPELGGEEAYDALVLAARSRGIRIVQDISFVHAGRGYPPYDDVELHGQASRWAPWFQWKDGRLVHYGKRRDAPLFDQTNPEVQSLVLETVRFWARRGASALRLDMTAEVPIELAAKIRSTFRDLVPDGLVFGEVVPQHAWRWRVAKAIDAATDFGFHEIVTELVCADRLDVAKAIERLRESDLLRGGDASVHSVRFLSTHDHTRLTTLAAAKGMADRIPAALALLATMPGIPMILYGEEYGLASTTKEREPEDIWPDRMPMPESGDAASLRSLLQARASSLALRAGSLEVLFADETTLVFRREAEGDVVDVAINFGDEPNTVELEDDEHPILTPLAALGGADAVGQAVRLPKASALLARREGKDVFRGRRNLYLRDQDLVGGETVAHARPSRFYFSITERCNLRCAHCITHAPERTKDGSARTMTPAVLAAIAPDFALGEYFAFVHGGESLTAPIFFDVLQAIAAAKQGEPYVAHLLTNGALLDRPVAEKLVARGVSSISISLDGATQATNDAIRLGGRFLDVRENLQRVLKWRTTEGIDLRIGISSVILQQNVHELEALVELGADLGVDWIKLEEGVPATEFAKRSLVSVAATEVAAKVQAAMKLGRERGLVMVDHTIEHEIWRCQLDERTRAFLEADEYANRTTIHPCRVPYETVCVEPNGDVRVRDFFGPILGNVTQTALGELWNAEQSLAVRRHQLLARVCGPTGPVVCID